MENKIITIKNKIRHIAKINNVTIKNITFYLVESDSVAIVSVDEKTCSPKYFNRMDRLAWKMIKKYDIDVVVKF